MTQKLSNLASIIFHPMLMPFIGIIIILHSGIYNPQYPWRVEKIIYLIMFLIIVILPVSFMLFLKYWKMISNLQLEERKQRFLPLFFTTFTFYLCYHAIGKIMPNTLVSGFIFAAFVSVFFLLIINIFWKISMHMISLGGIAGLTIFISYVFLAELFYLMIGILLISGIIGSARIYLKSHSKMQIYIGFLSGLVIVFTSMIFFA